MHERGSCLRCGRPLFWIEGRGLGIYLHNGTLEVFDPMCMKGMELPFEDITWGQHEMDLPASTEREEVERWLTA